MKQPFFLLTFLLVSLNSFASPIVCEGRNHKGDISNVVIYQNDSHIVISYRCYETGDIWLDCDTDRDDYDYNEGTYKMNPWRLEIDPHRSAQLYLKDELWRPVLTKNTIEI